MTNPFASYWRIINLVIKARRPRGSWLYALNAMLTYAPAYPSARAERKWVRSDLAPETLATIERYDAMLRKSFGEALDEPKAQTQLRAAAVDPGLAEVYAKLLATVRRVRPGLLDDHAA